MEKYTILRHSTLSKPAEGRGSFWPTVARLADGRLCAVWSGGRMNHLCPFGRVDISYSSDEGESWTPAVTAFDSPLDDRDAGIVAWGNKTVITTFNNSVAIQRSWIPVKGRIEGEAEAIEEYLDTITPEMEEHYLGSLIFFSDDGERMGEMQKMPITTPHGPIVLKDGRLLYVGRAYSGRYTLDDPVHGDTIHAMTTLDGASWTDVVLPPTPDDRFFLCEPHAVECGNGKIIVAARAQYEDIRLTMVTSCSSDGGKSWSAWKKTDYNGGPPHFTTLTDGRILLTYGRREAPLGIRARVSDDNGESWSEEIILRDDMHDSDLGYPSSVQLKNGDILTIYYNRRIGERLPEIQQTVWKLN